MRLGKINYLLTALSIGNVCAKNYKIRQWLHRMHGLRLTMLVSFFETVYSITGNYHFPNIQPGTTTTTIKQPGSDIQIIPATKMVGFFDIWKNHNLQAYKMCIQCAAIGNMQNGAVCNYLSLSWVSFIVSVSSFPAVSTASHTSHQPIEKLPVILIIRNESYGSFEVSWWCALVAHKPNTDVCRFISYHI